MPDSAIPQFHNSTIPKGIVLQPAWSCLAFVDVEFFSRWRSEVSCDVRFWHWCFRGACRASPAVPVLQGLEHGTRHLPRNGISASLAFRILRKSSIRHSIAVVSPVTYSPFPILSAFSTLYTLHFTFYTLHFPFASYHLMGDMPWLAR